MYRQTKKFTVSADADGQKEEIRLVSNQGKPFAMRVRVANNTIGQVDKLTINAWVSGDQVLDNASGLDFAALYEGGKDNELIPINAAPNDVIGFRFDEGSTNAQDVVVTVFYEG